MYREIEKAPINTPSPHSESIWCPNCGEEFGIESKVEDERVIQRDADHEYYTKLLSIPIEDEELREKTDSIIDGAIDDYHIHHTNQNIAVAKASSKLLSLIDRVKEQTNNEWIKALMRASILVSKPSDLQDRFIDKVKDEARKEGRESEVVEVKSE